MSGCSSISAGRADSVRAVAAAEITGGALLAFPATRRLGAGVLAVTSAAVLVTELQRREMKLAGPRALLLGIALTALFSPRRAW